RRVVVLFEPQAMPPDLPSFPTRRSSDIGVEMTVPAPCGTGLVGFASEPFVVSNQGICFAFAHPFGAARGGHAFSASLRPQVSSEPRDKPGRGASRTTRCFPASRSAGSDLPPGHVDPCGFVVWCQLAPPRRPSIRWM